MTLRQANHNSHFLFASSPSLASERHPSTTAPRTKLNLRDRHTFVLSVAIRARVFSTLVSLLSLRRGVASWRHYREFRDRNIRKSDGRLSATMNNCSDRYFPKSPEHFGRIKQLPILPLSPIVRCARPSFIWPASANGRATPSPPSSPKFYPVTRCAT
jgi:hypothetical protein